MSHHSFCYISAVFEILSDTVPDSNKRKTHKFGSELALDSWADSHPVELVAYVDDLNINISEAVGVWGNLAHNGDMEAPLAIFVQSFERFPWAGLSGQYRSHEIN